MDVCEYFYYIDTRFPSRLGKEKPWIILANRKHIGRLTLDGSSYDIMIENRSRVIAVDFDVRQSTIYWSDVTDNAIYRATAKKSRSGVLSEWKVNLILNGFVICVVVLL